MIGKTGVAKRRLRQGTMVDETRKYFIFEITTSRLVGTKAETKEEAIERIEETLETTVLKEAA